MANTITLSISNQDKSDLERDKSISPSKLFRSAMVLYRSREEFLDIYDILDYKLTLRELQDKISYLGKEIQRRNERIDSLQDVLAQKELGERRLREVVKNDNGLIAANPQPQSGISNN